MNTCDTCKHWSGHDLSDERFKICSVLEKKRYNDSEDGIAFAGSLDNDRNIIHTGAKFGCIHWETKVTLKPHPDQELMESLYQKILKDGGEEL